MVAKDELVPGIAMFSERGFEPRELDMALPSKAAPERVDEHHQEVAAPHEVGETRLSRRPIFRQVQHCAKHRLAHHIIGRVIAGRVPHRNGRTVEPCHFHIQPIAPLRAQRVRIRRQSDDFIARKQNEFRLRLQALNDRVDRGEGLLVRCSRHA